MYLPYKEGETTNCDLFTKKLKKITTPRPQRYFPSKVNTYHKNRRWNFIESDDITELYLMSQCHHHIISNSSFSWWASYMSSHNGTIVAPRQWFGKKAKINTKDLYRKKWILL